jgi:CheY-like chemotaxis protein
MMGGDVIVESAYGKGSKFTLTLVSKIAGNERIATVESPETKRVLIIESREIYAESIIFTLKSLEIDCTWIDDFSELELADAEVNYTDYQFIFVSTKFSEQAAKLVSSFEIKPTLVLLAEYGEAAIDPNQRVIAMPVQPISIANILNDKEDESYYKKSTLGLHYIIPEARLLIVDDIPTNLQVAKGLLSPLGAQIDTCLSGADALERIQQNDYDVVFMDHMMPEMDGIETTAAIRAFSDEKYQKLPIIALTANAISGMQEMFLANGFNDYISKPIETTKLYDTVNKWVPKEKRVNSGGKNEDLASEKITIAGVNTELGLRLAGGNSKNYISVLTLFCEDAKTRFTLLEKVPQAGDDLRLFTTQVHALKSVLATIGAEKLSKRAAALESAASAADFEIIQRDTGRFRKDLSALMADIATALPARAKNKTNRNITLNRLSAEFLSELSAALAEKNGIEADKLIDTVDVSQYDEQSVRALNAVSNAVLLFDFEAALAVLRDLQA